jgi:hypothetical protein
MYVHVGHCGLWYMSNPKYNMSSVKPFGSKPVVKYAYIGISADRQGHNWLWLFKYRICPIRIEIIHGGLSIYWFYHGLALYADILPFAIARGKIFRFIFSERSFPPGIVNISLGPLIFFVPKNYIFKK